MTKKPFGLGAVTNRADADTPATGHVAPPPPSNRPPIDHDLERQISDTSERMFPNALSREPHNPPAQSTQPEVPPNQPQALPLAYQPRTRSQREEAETIFIRAPKSVADRFAAVMEANQLRAKWDALALLLDIYEKVASDRANSDE